MHAATHILGHSQAEIGRLIHQAAILQTITEHLPQMIQIVVATADFRRREKIE